MRGLHCGPKAATHRKHRGLATGLGCMHFLVLLLRLVLFLRSSEFFSYGVKPDLTKSGGSPSIMLEVLMLMNIPSYMYVVIVPKSAQSLHLTVLRAVIR
jgi:hypothetical protein